MIYYDLTARPNIVEEHYDHLEDKIKSNIANSSLNKNCKSFIETNLEDIITSKPNKLIRLNNRFSKLSSYNPNSKIQKNKVKAIFDYGWFITKRKTVYDAYDLAKKLNIRACLYCNRMYTITIIKGTSEEDKITRPQFDHFFDKDSNPLLALSIYNLIPSCSICNTTLKGKTKFNSGSYIHPFIHNYVNQYWYRYIPYDLDSILGNKSNLKVGIDFDYSLLTKDRRRISRSAKIFKLNAIYSGHTEELKDLFDIRYRFSEKYFKELFNTYSHLKLSKDEVYRIVFGTEFNEGNFHKRPFSKIKKDLLIELGVITK